MLEDRGRCGWGAVVAAVTLFATLLVVTPAARATVAPGPASVAVVVREHAGAGQGPERRVAGSPGSCRSSTGSPRPCRSRR
jgi:hypothetical protein